MSLINTIKETVNAANRVLTLSEQIDELAVLTKEQFQKMGDQLKQRDLRVRELEDRVLRLETMFDIGIKTGMIKLPSAS